MNFTNKQTAALTKIMETHSKRASRNVIYSHCGKYYILDGCICVVLPELPENFKPDAIDTGKGFAETVSIYKSKGANSVTSRIPNEKELRALIKEHETWRKANKIKMKDAQGKPIMEFSSQTRAGNFNLNLVLTALNAVGDNANFSLSEYTLKDCPIMLITGESGISAVVLPTTNPATVTPKD